MNGNGGNTIQQRQRQQQQLLALNDVTVSFDYGTLTAVIGPVRQKYWSTILLV